MSRNYKFNNPAAAYFVNFAEEKVKAYPNSSIFQKFLDKHKPTTTTPTLLSPDEL